LAVAASCAPFLAFPTQEDEMNSVMKTTAEKKIEDSTRAAVPTTVIVPTLDVNGDMILHIGTKAGCVSYRVSPEEAAAFRRLTHIAVHRWAN
jgi:hypothetical protein